MKSPSHYVMLARQKRKAMKMDPDVVDSGGSPQMDLQDLDSMHRNEATDELDENVPVEHNEMNDLDGHDLSPHEEMLEEEHMSTMHEDEPVDDAGDTEMLGHRDEISTALLKRKARAMKRMGL